MIIRSATFIKSSQTMAQLPLPNYPEYGFVGRSNVGKSSLINCLVEHKQLAKTSSTPGKTQLINHFLINESWYLADLPGYGYAKTSKTKRARFADMILNYCTDRKNLQAIFVLIDSRIKPQSIDLEFLEFLGIKQIPFVILFTKIDKLNQKEFSKNMRQYKHTLNQTWEELPPMVNTSAVKGRGRKEILEGIEDLNQKWKPV
ncbi:MAG: ribosome biogenesis GTP-binding protein YihA/YsxC [Bacteroidota bacterium]